MTKIFPYLGDNNPDSSFTLLLVSEGYLSGDSMKFASDCMDFVEQLLRTAPFSLSRINPNWLSIYSHFTPSNTSGTAIGASTVGRTAFQSAYDETSKTLMLDQSSVNSFLNTVQLTQFGTARPFSSFMDSGDQSYGPTATLVMFLIPPLSGHPEGSEMKSVPSADADYYFCATTTDQLWHQVVFRAMCDSLGLGDEFELDGPDYLAPVPDQNNSFTMEFNLKYSDVVPTTAKFMPDWAPIFNATQRLLPIPVHSKSGTPATPDNSIEQPALFHPDIEYWEGGGGYRTKVYRTAADCLMRRKFGSSELPIRANEISFCPACYYFLKVLIR